MEEEIAEGTPAYSPEVDPRDVATSETIRTRFDCSGTPWAERVSQSGTSCHAMPWATGAPLVGDCGVYIMASDGNNGWKPVHPAEGAKWSPFDISDAMLFALGGARKYRVSLRYASKTIPHSYLLFDLSGRGHMRPLPGEVESGAAKAPPPAPPSPADTAATMALGAAPMEALMGSAVASVADPMTRFAFGMLMREASNERTYRKENADRDERMFQFMVGTIASAARGGGGGETATLLREQLAEMRKANDQNAAARAQLEQQVHQRDLAAAHAKGADAPNPLAVAFAQGLQAAIPTVAVKALEMAGPQNVQAVANMAVAAMGAAG